MNWIPYLVVVAVAAWLMIVLPPTARKIGLIDYPDIRKQHELEVPLLGGVGYHFSGSGWRIVVGKFGRAVSIPVSVHTPSRNYWLTGRYSGTDASS